MEGRVTVYWSGRHLAGTRWQVTDSSCANVIGLWLKITLMQF